MESNRYQNSTFIQGGDSCFTFGNYKDALFVYDQVLKYDKKNVTLLTKKGNALHRLHKKSKAYRCYFEALLYSEALDRIDQYIEQYPDLQSNVIQLQNLLIYNYNIPITDDGLLMVLKETQKKLDERRRIKEWEQFKKQLQQKQLGSPEDYADLFLRRFGDLFYRHFFSFYCYLCRRGMFNLSMSKLADIIQRQRRKIELEQFESFLQSGRKQPMLDRMTGIQFEEYLTEYFNSCGYQVTRTHPSHDQGADIVLKRFGETIAVQVKRRKQAVGNKAIQEVYAAQRYYFAQKAIVITTSSFTKSAIALANRTGVELWDRKILLEKIRNPGYY